MALAGVTAVGEFHYLHHGPGGEPYADPNEIGTALIAAAGEAGIRITLLDACYLHGGIGEPLERGPASASPTADAEAWAERVDGARRRAGGADRRRDPQRPRGRPRRRRRRSPPGRTSASARCTPTSPSSRPRTRPACGAYGATPAGGARARRGARPAVHRRPRHPPRPARTSPRSAAARCCCCLCPTTERDLADGIGPARALADAGAALALGSDSHAVIDQFEEARAVELDERLATRRARPPRRRRAAAAPRPRDGHAALGWPEAGRDRAGRARRPGHGRARRRAARRDDRRDGARGGRVRRRRAPTSSG